MSPLEENHIALNLTQCTQRVRINTCVIQAFWENCFKLWRFNAPVFATKKHPYSAHNFMKLCPYKELGTVLTILISIWKYLPSSMWKEQQSAAVTALFQRRLSIYLMQFLPVSVRNIDVPALVIPRLFLSHPISTASNFFIKEIGSHHRRRSPWRKCTHCL